MIPQAEDRRAARRRIRANPFEHADAVVKARREERHGRFLRVDDGAVHPDEFAVHDEDDTESARRTLDFNFGSTEPKYADQGDGEVAMT